MSKPKAPAPPDPKATSAASTSTNVGTAIANAWLGNISEKTPDGSTSIDQTGSKSWFDPYTEKTYDVPTFTRTTTLSPEQQAIADKQNAANLNLSTLGANLSGTLGSQLTGNFKLGNEASEARLMELGRNRLDPALAQQDEATRTRLAQQGIKAGSTAYDREMATLGQNRNDAYNQLLLSGRAQSNQEMLTEDNQRINQISALMSGSQVSQPQFMGANMPTIATTDTAGIINQNYAQQQANYQQEMGAYNGLMGGLFSLGGSLGGAAIRKSDERIKENIEPIGEVNGHNVYEYDFKGEHDDGKRHFGVMAQEVEKKDPDAVLNGKDGIKRVNYSKIGLGHIFGMGA
jgi:hypothetical protein